ncbi:hypothetical protein A4A49_41884 [Nicotiana attenuata]|uniref:Uncharacterized protein n=1 Tax=Nicotiana attenuata TaxID=49451 RepID=A0A1J6KD26_NICAT|nr:hypothetical protein A4A49_41884 [Nicotiana attenuata]
MVDGAPIRASHALVADATKENTNSSPTLIGTAGDEQTTNITGMPVGRRDAEAGVPRGVDKQDATGDRTTIENIAVGHLRVEADTKGTGQKFEALATAVAIPIEAEQIFEKKKEVVNASLEATTAGNATGVNAPLGVGTTVRGVVNVHDRTNVMIAEEKPAGSKPAAVKNVSHVLEGEKQAAKGPGFDHVQARIPSAAGHINTRQDGAKGDDQVQNLPEKDWTMVSSKKGTPNKNKVQQVEQISRNNSNPFAALANVNDDDGKIAGENLQLVECNNAQNLDQNSCSTPAALNLTPLGAQILENMNPTHAFTGNLAPIPLAQHYKAEVNNATVYKVGLNTSNQDIPSNDASSFSEESVHPTRSREALSMMSSASKMLTKNVETNEAIVQNFHELEEADMSKSKSWADQVEEEEGNEADSADSYREIVKKNTSSASAQINRTPKSNVSTERKQKFQQLQHTEIGKVHNVLTQKSGQQQRRPNSQ